MKCSLCTTKSSDKCYFEKITSLPAILESNFYFLLIWANCTFKTNSQQLRNMQEKLDSKHSALEKLKYRKHIKTTGGRGPLCFITVFNAILYVHRFGLMRVDCMLQKCNKYVFCFCIQLLCQQILLLEMSTSVFPASE